MARISEENINWLNQIKFLPLEERAKKVAMSAHANQYRDDGKKPYFVHPSNVVNIIQAAGGHGNVLIASAWLHDVVEDTEWTIEEIYDIFGKEVAETVSMLTLHLPHYPKDFSKEKRMELKTLALIGKTFGMSYKAKIIKIADRIDNLLSAEETWPPSRQRAYAQQATRMFEAMNLTSTEIMPQYHVYKELMFNANNIISQIMNNTNEK